MIKINNLLVDEKKSILDTMGKIKSGWNKMPVCSR